MSPRQLLPLLVLAAAMAAFACGGGSGDDDDGNSPPSTADAGSPPATSSPAAPTEPPVDTSIRDVVINSVPDVQSIVASTPDAAVPLEDIIYADITGDRVEEAIVPVASGGTLGNIAFIVLTPGDAGATRTLLSQNATAGGGLALAVAEGALVVTEPVYGPDDPECCPGLLQRSTYVWDGEALVLDTQDTEPNPEGAEKPTPEGG
jgi:hypothetical protein